MAPGSAVILVGTHQDQVLKSKGYIQLLENYKSIIYQRFIDTSQSERIGYPKVLDSVQISNRTGVNIKQLCTLIYDVAAQLLLPGRRNKRKIRRKVMVN